MILNGDIRCASDDAQGLLEELQRRTRSSTPWPTRWSAASMTRAATTACCRPPVLEEQIRQRTEELTAALEALGEVSARATAARLQLETAVDNISDGFALFDPEDRLLLCNEAFRQLDRLASNAGNRPLGNVLAETARLTPPPAEPSPHPDAERDKTGAARCSCLRSGPADP
jgi:hypothetical protein